jgi:hypothetical protein
MNLAKIIDATASGAGIPNEIRLSYPQRADTQSQAALQLKSHWLIIGKSLKNISGRTPLEKLQSSGGPNLFLRAAKHIVATNLPWAAVLQVLEELAANGKLTLDIEQRELAVYMLKEALYDTDISYKTV